jgi:hypothetical protein
MENEVAKKLNALFFISQEHDETRFELLYSNLVCMAKKDKENNFELFLEANIFQMIQVKSLGNLFLISPLIS